MQIPTRLSCLARLQRIPQPGLWGYMGGIFLGIECGDGDRPAAGAGGSSLRKDHRCHPSGFRDPLVASNTDDFPKVSLMAGNGLRKDHRCHPANETIRRLHSRFTSLLLDSLNGTSTHMAPAPISNHERHTPTSSSSRSSSFSRRILRLPPTIPMSSSSLPTIRAGATSV